MLFHASKKEAVVTIAGALLLAALAAFIGIPQEITVSTLYDARIILEQNPLIAIELVLGVLLFFGLLAGFRRHKDASPLIFAFLGFGGLLMNFFGNLPLYLPLLCSLCFLIEGLWSISLRKEDAMARKTEAPRLDSFLDNLLLPEENTDEESKKK